MNKQKFIGLFRLFRFELPFTAGVCVILGEILAIGGVPSFKHLAFGFISIFCISATTLILNDYFDIETDRINSPTRPLPSGIVTKSEALILSIVVVSVGFLFSLLISVEAFLISVFVWAVGFLYNWKFKKTGLLGNMFVGFSVGMTFIFGGVAVGNPFEKIVWFLAFITFFIDLGEEIAADSLDVDGDRSTGSRSLAVLYGAESAMKISAGIFGIIVAGSVVPFIFGWMERIYAVPIILLDIVIIYSVTNLLKFKKAKRINDIRRIYLGGLAVLLMITVIRIGESLGYLVVP